MSADARLFTEWLLNQVPKYDKSIIEDMRPVSHIVPNWFSIREMVRKLSEGESFVASKCATKDMLATTDGFIYHTNMCHFDAFIGPQHTRDRFNSVYPDVK